MRLLEMLAEREREREEREVVRLSVMEKMREGVMRLYLRRRRNSRVYGRKERRVK
jgi:hypothetical protein